MFSAHPLVCTKSQHQLKGSEKGREERESGRGERESGRGERESGRGEGEWEGGRENLMLSICFSVLCIIISLFVAWNQVIV